MSTGKAYLIGGIVFVLFLAISLTRLGVFALDETGSHFPNALNFYNHGLDAVFNPEYSAANTPLPYLIVSLVARIAGPTLVVARVVTAVVSFLAFLVVVRLLVRDGTPPYLAFVVLFYPYLFLNSFLFYAVNYGLLFFLLGMLSLRRTDTQPSYARDFAAGCFLALAVLCQQFYLGIPVAVVFSRFLAARIRGEKGLPFPDRQTLISTAFLVVPLIVPIMLFFAWGGLTHPNFRQHAVGIYPSTITATFTVTGFYFAPFLLQEFRNLKRSMTVIALGISIILALAWTPVFTDRYGPGEFAGVVHHLIALAGRIHPFVPMLLTILLTFSGILVLILVWKGPKREWEYQFYASCILLAIAYACYTYIGERHLLGFLVILFLLVLPRMRKPWQWIYPIIMALFGIGYFVWWFFFKWTE